MTLCGNYLELYRNMWDIVRIILTCVGFIVQSFRIVCDLLGIIFSNHLPI